MSNPHEALARERKADAIADVLVAHCQGWLPDEVAALVGVGRTMRKQIADAAHVRPPSVQTWELAINKAVERVGLVAVSS